MAHLLSHLRLHTYFWEFRGLHRGAFWNARFLSHSCLLNLAALNQLLFYVSVVQFLPTVRRDIVAPDFPYAPQKCSGKHFLILILIDKIGHIIYLIHTFVCPL